MLGGPHVSRGLGDGEPEVVAQRRILPLPAREDPLPPSFRVWATRINVPMTTLCPYIEGPVGRS